MTDTPPAGGSDTPAEFDTHSDMHDCAPAMPAIESVTPVGGDWLVTTPGGRMHVPADLSNRDARAVQAWLDAGNTPTPPDPLEVARRDALILLAATDPGMARTVEDLITLLEEARVIQRTQFPQASQLRLAAREAAREALGTPSPKGTP